MPLCVCLYPGVGGTLNFLYIRRLELFFAVQNFEFHFLGYEDFMDIFWGHHNIYLFLGVIFWILGSFLNGKVQNGGYFFGLLKFQIFFGVLDIPDILGSRLWCLTESLSLSHWYPGSGVVLDCIDS